MSKQAIFTPLLLAALLFFAWSIYRRLSLVTLGKPSLNFRGIGVGLREMFLYAFMQKRVLHKAFGINHFVIFWAFMALLLVNCEFMVSGVVPSLRLSLLPDGLYLPVRFISDFMAALTLTAVIIALVRRTFFPPYTGARTLEAYAILLIVGIHMVAYLGLAGTEIALGMERGASAMPVSRGVASLFACGGGGCARCGIVFWSEIFWWLHAVALFAFITVLIPFTKHLHVITAITNCFLHREGKPNRQEPEDFAPGNVYGAGQVDRFTTRDLLDSFACTKCGSCQNVCPADITGKSLNPRQVIENIRLNLLANGSCLKRGEKPLLPLIGESGAGSVAEEAIWSCTTCGACMEICPVFIEHVPKLVGMRRHLVEMESKFPEELLNLFENMEQRSNPWGIAPGDRGKWAAPIGGRPFEAGRTEYLYYVGCSGSFDSRQKQVTVALSTIMDAAGVSWGILGKEELCCGDSLRRLGNEYVYDRMARKNVKLFQEKGVTKIVTQCPHCFTTLKNDYRDFGLEVEVEHQSQLIDRFIREGKINITAKIDWVGKVLYHDSCYLGRHNEIYDEPRHVLSTVTGNEPMEFARSRENSFCCGGGGGRMWLEEDSGRRINIERVEEGVRMGANTICVSCPYCLTMIEDGLKDVQTTGTRVMDVAEIVSEGLRMSQ